MISGSHLFILLALLSIGVLASVSHAAGRAKYFVLVVWDGMRPDFVSPELTPALCALRSNGVWFANHHSVYPTATEVNGTVLATGVFPRRSGILANKEYRPELDKFTFVGTEVKDVVRRGDTLTGGKYLHVPTVAELVQADGKRTAVAGSKPIALLHDRKSRATNSPNLVWFSNGTLPSKKFDDLFPRLGLFPDATTVNTARDEWTTRCLIEAFWAEELPRYSVLWLSEPDNAQHKKGPGSPEALAAIRSSDARLAAVLRELDRRGVRAETDVLVVSDHGFSTIGAGGDIAGELRKAGLNARTAWKTPPADGDVVTVGNGGSMLLYVTGKSPVVIEKVVKVLQQRAESGVVFTRDGLPGTFPLSAVMLDSPAAPDVIVSSSWKMSALAPGIQTALIINDGYNDYKPGSGMHVTLSPTDLHNTAVAAGPDFRSGFVSSLPSGNVDIAPTLLSLMGIKPPEPLDGRVLGEAFVDGKAPAGVAKPDQLDAKAELADGTWRQYLKFTEFGGVRYLEEGNGRWMPGSVSSSSGSKAQPK